MTGRRLMARERRVVAAGGLLICAIAMVSHGLPSWIQWRTSARELAEGATRGLADDRAILQNYPSVIETLERRVAWLREQSPAPLVQQDTARAALAFADIVTTASHAAGITLSSVQSEIGEPGVAGTARVMVALHATSDAAGLVALLHALEAGPVLTHVRQLVVTAHQVAGGPDQIETLTFHLRVEGMILLTPRTGEP